MSTSKAEYVVSTSYNNVMSTSKAEYVMSTSKAEYVAAAPLANCSPIQH